MRIFFEIYGGVIGMLILLCSVIFYLFFNVEIALLTALLTLLSLSPYVTINSFREKYGDSDSVSRAWRGRFGTILHLLNIFNLFWLGFLVYQVTSNIWLTILVVIFKLLVLPRIVLKFL